jgi:hypothetical protein
MIDPADPSPIHRRMIPLTLAEIRKLLNLVLPQHNSIAHGLRWSAGRAAHTRPMPDAHTCAAASTSKYAFSPVVAAPA